MRQDVPFIDDIYRREALKIEILADRPVIPAFIRNSYGLWMASQFSPATAEKIFYGSGAIHQVLGRLLARKACITAWRQSKEDGNTLRLIEPLATVLDHARRIAGDLQDFFKTDTPYDALVEFQTPGYTNPLERVDIIMLAEKVEAVQKTQHLPVPSLSREDQRLIIRELLSLAEINPARVEIIEDVAHPACLGYGGMAKGVKLGLTYDYGDPVTGILTNWHEIGHAAYRQSVPHGRMVAGRAMDEAAAYLFEHHVGRGDDFLSFLLDIGLRAKGYDLAMLQSHVRQVDRNTKRIETDPLRHSIDIYLAEALERALINEEIEAEDAHVYWAKLIEPFTGILPEEYPFYWDVHIMTGIYGDRACYTPGLLSAFQIGQAHAVGLHNLTDFVTEKISLCEISRFDDAVLHISGEPLGKKAFMAWTDKTYQKGRVRPPQLFPA